MRVGIYGLGRFGSFWADTVRRNTRDDIEIVASSRHPHAVPEGVVFLEEDELFATCDVLFFCVAISSFESVLKNMNGRIKKGAVVFDTCSVKAYPARWMKEYLGDDYTLIASHPMFGPDSAKNGLKGLPIVLCPLDADEKIVQCFTDEFASWGLKVLRMTPLVHDKEAAYSQGVTHFVGRTLREMGLCDTEIATSGYKALMTIVDQTCNDPLQLFYDLQRFNPYAKEMRLSLQYATEKILNKLRESEEV